GTRQPGDDVAADETAAAENENVALTSGRSDRPRCRGPERGRRLAARQCPRRELARGDDPESVAGTILRSANRAVEGADAVAHADVIRIRTRPQPERREDIAAEPGDPAAGHIPRAAQRAQRAIH